jgi:hypothetical protein
MPIAQNLHQRKIPPAGLTDQLSLIAATPAANINHKLTG